MPMKNPPHPGRGIRTACLKPLRLSVTEDCPKVPPPGFSRHNIVFRAEHFSHSHWPAYAGIYFEKVRTLYAIGKAIRIMCTSSP